MLPFSANRSVHTEPAALFAGRDELSARVRIPFASALLDPLLGLGDLERLWSRALREDSAGTIFDALLRALGVRCLVKESDVERIPKSGAAVMVANHPCGLLEGPAIGSAICQRRQDVRFLANSILTSVPELRPFIIPVEIFGRPGDSGRNAAALLAAYRWLREGGVLVVFPAGEVSSVHFREFKISDPPWDDRLFRLFRSARATLVPVYVSGANSVAFHVAGMINPALRTMLLGRELLNKQNQQIALDFGSPVGHDRLAAFSSDRALTEYVRARTYVLHHRRAAKHIVRKSIRRPQPIIPPVSLEAVRGDIDALPRDAKLCSGGSMEVYVADAIAIPHAFAEVARLREITFRAVGEGTGKPADRDAFDSHYQHLILWDREAQLIAGAYRMTRIDQTLDEHGPSGLYASTLFHLKAAFLDRVRAGIELGRSFVRTEYQKDFQPLYLLWKAIAAFVARHPQYRYLMGPASVSSDYSRTTRELIVAYCAAQFRMSAAVEPRHRLRVPALSKREIDTLGHLIGEPSELSEIVSDIEPDGKPLPVLLRQYLALGGEVLGFSVDPSFSAALDGLVLVDLMATKPSVLGRYMGKQNAERYRALHQQQTVTC